MSIEIVDEFDYRRVVTILGFDRNNHLGKVSLLEINNMSRVIKSIFLGLKMILPKRNHLATETIFVLFELDEFKEFFSIF